MATTVTIQQASQPLWEIGLVALGGAVIGGVFAMLGGWRERVAARKARQDERAALRAAEHRSEQRRHAERLMREVSAMTDAYSDVDISGIAWRITRGTITDPAIRQARLDDYNQAARVWYRAQTDAVGTASLLDDAALRDAVMGAVLEMSEASPLVKPLRDTAAKAADAQAAEDETNDDRNAAHERLGALIPLLGAAARDTPELFDHARAARPKGQIA